MMDRDRANPGSTPYGTSLGFDRNAGAKGSGEEMKQQAGHIADQVKDQAVQMKDKVADTATGALEDRKAQTSSGLGDVAQTIRQTSEELRSQDQGAIANYVDQAADQLERVTGYLREHDVRHIVGDVERFARREPTLFLGGAFLLGVLGARFLKSSSQAADEQGSRWQERQGYGTEAALSSYSSYASMSHTQPLAVRSTGMSPQASGDTAYSAAHAGGGNSGIGTGGNVRPSHSGTTAPSSTSSRTGAPDWDTGTPQPSGSTNSVIGTGARETTPGANTIDSVTDTRSKGDAGA